MNDFTLNLIALAVFAALGGLVFFLVRRRQAENEQRLIQMAAERGWTYESIREPLAWGLRLTAPNWTLEAISRSSGQESAPGSSEVAMSTTWKANAPGSTVLIGARTSQSNLGGLGDLLTRQVFQLALGAEATGLTESQAGSEVFRQKFMLWAQDALVAAKLCTPALESALLTWKGSAPLIKRTSSGLQIEITGQRFQKVDQVMALVFLGEILLTALKK